MKKNKSNWYILGVLATNLLLIVTLSFPDSNSEIGVADVRPGMPAPLFELDSVRGDEFSLSHRDRSVVLVSFLDSRADATSNEADLSRSQIVFLKSMQEQYGEKGLRILIIDASYLVSSRQVHPDDLLNFTYNWALDNDILVLIDDAARITARKYGVSQLPTTFLIDAQNTIIQRWDGYASASQLAFALQELVGAPAHRGENFPIQPPGSDTASRCASETPAQAQFAGLGLARALSDQIWVVDAGQNWGVGAPWPLHWILLDHDGKLKGNSSHLSVSIQNLKTGKIQILVDEKILSMSSNDAQGLLKGFADPKPRVYLLTNTVYFETPGCFQLFATVTYEGSTIPLYTGAAFIQAGE